MKKLMLASLVVIVVLAGSYLAFVQILIHGLDGETIEHPTETRQKSLANGGKFEVEITLIEETGWGGDSYREMEYFYRPPDADRREFVGRSRERGYAKAHLMGDRVLVAHSDAIFLRSSEGVWQEIRWASYRFPGRESQAARSVLDRHPNQGGLFEIIQLDPALSALSVEYRVADDTYLFQYAIRDDQSGVDLTDIQPMKRPSSPFDTEAETYWQGLEAYTKWVLPNSHARAAGVDQQAEQEKFEEHLLSIADQLNDKMGRAFIAERRSLTQDGLEHSYIAWIREKHMAN